MRQSVDLRSPYDQEPKERLQPLMALCEPPVGAQRLSLCHRGLPGLLPLTIADRIAQHQHRVHVLSTPAHASPFESCFHDQLVGTFHAA